MILPPPLPPSHPEENNCDNMMRLGPLYLYIYILYHKKEEGEEGGGMRGLRSGRGRRRRADREPILIKNKLKAESGEGGGGSYGQSSRGLGYPPCWLLALFFLAVYVSICESPLSLSWPRLLLLRLKPLFITSSGSADALLLLQQQQQ